MRIAAPEAIAMRAPRTRAGDGDCPGGTGPSRTEAPMIVSIPATNSRPSAASTVPIPRSIPRVRVALVCMGTTTNPLPAGPSSATYTEYTLAVMIHRSCAHTPGSPGTMAASSAGGAPLVPTFHCAARTVTRVGVP